MPDDKNQPPNRMLAQMLGGVEMEDSELRQALLYAKNQFNLLLKNAAASGVNVEIHPTNSGTDSDGIAISQIVVVIDGEALPLN